MSFHELHVRLDAVLPDLFPILVLCLLLPPTGLLIVWLIPAGRKRLLAVCRKALYPNTHSMAVSLRAEEEVRVELATLLKLTPASRAFLLRFHNGTSFYPSNPIWKLTCTSELVSSGVNYWRGEALHETHVTRWQEIVAPVIDDLMLRQHLDWTGIERQGQCAGLECSQGCDRITILFDVAHMPEGYVRSQLQKHGVATLLCTGLYAAHGQAVGIVGLDFFQSPGEVRKTLPDTRIKLCETTRRLQDILFINKDTAT